MEIPEDFVSLFNGKDFTYWKVPVGLQHHGSKVDGEWVSPPSLVQFRNIFIKEL